MDSSAYELLNFVHILAAAVWVGGGIMLQVLMSRARRSNDPARLSAAMTDAAWVGNFVFAPASIVLVLAGFGLVGQGKWDFDPWIIFGLAVWAISFVIAIAFYGRAAADIVELLGEHPADAPPVRSRVGRYFTVAGVESLLLILVIADMVVKPGL